MALLFGSSPAVHPSDAVTAPPQQLAPWQKRCQAQDSTAGPCKTAWQCRLQPSAALKPISPTLAGVWQGQDASRHP